MTTLSDYIDIGMSSPDITAAERAAVMSVLESRFLSLGPKIVAFEQALCRAYDAASHQLLARVQSRIAHAAPLLAAPARPAVPSVA